MIKKTGLMMILINGKIILISQKEKTLFKIYKKNLIQIKIKENLIMRRKNKFKNNKIKVKNSITMWEKSTKEKAKIKKGVIVLITIMREVTEDKAERIIVGRVDKTLMEEDQIIRKIKILI